MIAVPEHVRRALTLASIALPVRPLTGPYSLRMEVSSKCNYSCLMCPYHSSKATEVGVQGDLMDTGVAARMLEGAAKLGVKTVTFVGRGEPTMHPGFAGIVRLATTARLQSRLYTNGSLLTERRMLDLVEAGLSTLAVSLVGPSPDTYLRYHPEASPEAFARILDSISLLQEIKGKMGLRSPKVELRFILVEGSHLEVDKMVDLGIELGADAIHLSPLQYRWKTYVDPLALAREDAELAAQRLRELALRAASRGLAINAEEITLHHVFGPASASVPCYAGWLELNGLVDGTVTFCMRCYDTMGNVTGRSLPDIWADARYEKMRRSIVSANERAKVGDFDCANCGLFYTNLSIARRLNRFGLARGYGKMDDGEGQWIVGATGRSPGVAGRT